MNLSSTKLAAPAIRKNFGYTNLPADFLLQLDKGAVKRGCQGTKPCSSNETLVAQDSNTDLQGGDFDSSSY